MSSFPLKALLRSITTKLASVTLEKDHNLNTQGVPQPSPPSFNCCTKHCVVEHTLPHVVRVVSLTWWDGVSRPECGRRTERPDGTRPLGRPRLRWRDQVLGRLGSERGIAEDRKQWIYMKPKSI